MIKQVSITVSHSALSIISLQCSVDLSDFVGNIMRVAKGHDSGAYL